MLVLQEEHQRVKSVGTRRDVPRLLIPRGAGALSEQVVQEQVVKLGGHCGLENGVVGKELQGVDNRKLLERVITLKISPEPDTRAVKAINITVIKYLAALLG